MKVNRKHIYLSAPLLILPVIFIALFTSCMDDAEWYEQNFENFIYDTVSFKNITKQEGVFILNEGNFMYDNSSLSYYLIDSMKVLNEVFMRSNQSPLGDVAISMKIRDNLAYIIINNSNKIYIIDIDNFKFEGKITGLLSPRDIYFINDNKAYVTDLYAKKIAIVNPESYKITGYIDVSNSASIYYQHSTDQMVKFGKYIFTNCWSYDNKILVIDTEDDRLVDSIEVPIQPTSLVLDRYNNLWTLCDGGYEGNPYGHEQAALVRIDAETRGIEQIYYLGQDSWPSELQINGTRDTLYFLNKHVYRHSVNSPFSPELLIKSPHSSNSFDGGFYGLGIDPYSGNIYVADALDQVSQGIVYRYNSTGTAIDTFSVGILPGKFCFRRK